MNNQSLFFNLKIIDTKNIVTHEDYDSSRTQALAEKIRSMNIFINPILVAHVDGETYMQIDGMNRFSAIKHLGIPSILAQIVDYNDQNAVDVSTWCHLNPQSKKNFIAALEKISGLTINKTGYRYLRKRYIKETGPGYLCTVVFKDLTVYRIGASGKLADKIDKLREIVALYKKKIARDILPNDADSVDVMQLFKKKPAYNTLIIFPTFTRHQIINAAVHKGALFPSGITRFIIRGRCLDVNYPLADLSSKINVDQKNKKLEAFLANKKHRVYEEATIYFEP